MKHLHSWQDVLFFQLHCDTTLWNFLSIFLPVSRYGWRFDLATCPVTLQGHIDGIHQIHCHDKMLTCK